MTTKVNWFLSASIPKHKQFNKCEQKPMKWQNMDKHNISNLRACPLLVYEQNPSFFAQACNKLSKPRQVTN